MNTNIPGEPIDSQNVARNIPYDHVSQNIARNLSHDRIEHRTTMVREDSRDTYPPRYDAHNNIPHATMPHVHMRTDLDAHSQLKRDLTALVSQFASKIQLLTDNPMPPDTAADIDSPSPLTPDVVGRPPAVVAVPPPIPPAVPTGEPAHYDSGPRPQRQHIIKLESYAGQGASFEAFLEKYEKHSRY